MAGEKEINELLDRLLEGRSAEEVVGDGGLLADLTKRLMERVLEADVDLPALMRRYWPFMPAA